MSASLAAEARDDQKLRRAVANTKKMLRDRGYEVPEGELAEFQAERGDEVMFVEYFPKIGVDALKGFLAQLEGASARGIMLSDEPWTTHAEKAALESPFAIENFTVRAMNVSVLDGRYTPKQELFDAGDPALNGVDLDGAPRMPTSDPVARHFAAVPGQVVRVARKSPTAGELVAYRVVVRG